ncbi:hypothetical protein BDB00DRAFT_241619 [Zychaea mexicana]|nr:uncharacterized protein BDB00DRAFT_241619 [Zychaea mexicana]KAI9495299.1 hypothetical protein BDB00DRAFT_241619 [Zychaea mexicana]
MWMVFLQYPNNQSGVPLPTTDCAVLAIPIALRTPSPPVAVASATNAPPTPYLYPRKPSTEVSSKPVPPDGRHTQSAAGGSTHTKAAAAHDLFFYID